MGFIFMLYLQPDFLSSRVSRICFGGAGISGEGGGYGFGDVSESAAEKLIKFAWESGITLFDTAPIYGFGLSEERLGRYLPPEALIISKSGVDWHENKRVNKSNSSEITLKMLHSSLKRLRREVIDVYMIHWPDLNVDIRYPLEVLLKAQEQGKIKSIGLCNTHVEDLDKAEKIARIDVLQSELNLFNQQAFDQLNERWKKTVSMGWGTFDKGILTGRVTQSRKFDSSDARSWAPWWNKKGVQNKISRVNSLKTILGDYDFSLSDLCLSHALNHYGISTCLVGFKKCEDVTEVLKSLQSLLSKETIKEVLNRWQQSE
jgi:myo-inositol catabolism protein IolS